MITQLIFVVWMHDHREYIRFKTNTFSARINNMCISTMLEFIYCNKCFPLNKQLLERCFIL